MATLIDLHVRKFDGNQPQPKMVKHIIDPGHIPPNYEHSWVIDLSGIDAFHLAFDELDLAWHLGDRITLLDTDGKLLKVFKTAQDAKTQTVTLGPAPVAGKQGEHRVYLMLETAASFESQPHWHYHRRAMRISQINVTAQSGRAAGAYVVDDEIDYDTSGPFMDAYYFDAFNNKQEPLYPPWYADSIHSPSGQKRCKRPRRRDGWYLLGKNVHKAGKGFYELVYYNERTSKLRLFLFNIKLSEDVSLFNIEVGLRGKILPEKDVYANLKGAFFPLDPNPKNWSTANVTVADWPNSEWLCFDLPLLYPMAEELPIKGDPLYETYTAHPGSGCGKKHYLSLYEEDFHDDYKNVTLYTRIRGYQKSVLSGDFVGKAVGEAVQVFNKSDPYAFSNLVSTVADGISKGKNWYDKAKGVYDEAEKYYEKNKTEPAAAALKQLLNFGASAWGGPLAAAGFLTSILDSALFNKPEPMRLSLQLSLNGTFTGKAITPMQASEWWFYLPGAFSIKEAFSTTGLPTNDLDQVDSRLPRYDRTLGHFGYQYNPGLVELDMFSQAGLNSNYEWEYDHVVFPARHTFDAKKLQQIATAFPRPGYNSQLKALCDRYGDKVDIWVGGEIIRCEEVRYLASKEWRFGLEAIDSFGHPKIKEVLPVTYNPYAGIEPITSLLLPSGICSDYQTQPGLPNCSKLELRVYPSGPESVLECNKLRLYWQPVGTPMKNLELYRTETDSRLNGKEGFGFLVIPGNGDAKSAITPLSYATFCKSGRRGFGYSVTPLNTEEGDIRNWYNLWLGAHTVIGKDPFPLHDAIMTWTVKYRKKGRVKGAKPTEETAVLRSPITMNVKWSPACNFGDPTAFEKCFNLGAKVEKEESALLMKTGSPFPTP